MSAGVILPSFIAPDHRSPVIRKILFPRLGTKLVFHRLRTLFLFFSVNRAPGVTGVPCVQEPQPPSCLALSTCVASFPARPGFTNNIRTLYYSDALGSRIVYPCRPVKRFCAASQETHLSSHFCNNWIPAALAEDLSVFFSQPGMH